MTTRELLHDIVDKLPDTELVTAARILTALEQPADIPAPPGGVTTHFGVAAYSAATPTLERILSTAEQRLDEAKNAAARSAAI